ncbi:MAG: ORF6N domain-containing protein [bacterium]
MKRVELVPEVIERRILLIRGQKVILDTDLADLYEVETKALKRAVNRNRDRFPGDFMFVLTVEEYSTLRYQFGTLKRGRHSKHMPYKRRIGFGAEEPKVKYRTGKMYA